MSARSTPRKCTQCGVDVWWDGVRWRDELGENKCTGYAKGHKPNNKLRKDQIALINKLLP